MPSAMEVARYFLAQSDPDAGDTISNLKLQKLLYYAQGVTLALTGRPLFAEDIEAWQHGPVVPSVYRAYKTAGSGPVELDAEVHFDQFDQSTQNILNDVYQVYGQFSAWKLRNMTHDESPWANTPQGQVITHPQLSEFFMTRVIPDGAE